MILRLTTAKNISLCIVENFNYCFLFFLTILKAMGE